MWQEIIVGALVIWAIYYIARRIYREVANGKGGACPDCPPGELKTSLRK